MRFSALDGWRGLAAMMVALFHLGAVGWFHGVPAVRNGGAAVPLFFVLSGFVIHHAYGQRLGDLTAVWRFVVRRFGRLYPLHLFTLLLLVGLEIIKLVMVQGGISAGQPPFGGDSNMVNLAAQLLLLQGIIPFGYYGWNGPSWSISVEWAAYLVFAFVTLVARSSASAVVLVILSAGILLAQETLLPQLETIGGKGLPLAVMGFFSGGLVYRLYRALRSRGWNGGTGAEILAGVVIALLFWFRAPSLTLVIAGFAFAILIFAFEGGLLSRWLRQAPFQFLGRISYSIYLVHFVLLTVLNGTLRTVQSMTGIPLIRGAMIDFGPPGAMDALAVAYLAVLVLCSWGTYVRVEGPGRTFFNALSDRKPMAQAWRAALADARPAPAR